MRCFGMAEQKTPVGDIDLKSPSVEDRLAGPELSLQRCHA